MQLSQPMKKMLKITGIVFGLIFSWYLCKKILFAYFMSHYVPPAVTISASIAHTKNWQSYWSSVGTLTAVNGVDISAEAPGIVKEIHFESGQFIKKGDILVVLDSSVEQAQLKDNLARTKLAQLNYDRNKGLVVKHAVSQSQLDTLSAQLDEASAGVEQVKARIQQKTITAPFDGKIGIRLIDLGQYVSAGTNMVALQSLDPLYVRFNLPEQYLNQLYLQQPVEISINSNGTQSIKGVVTAINSKVDQATRNILVQATIPNKNLQLYPGMFALVKVLLREQKNVVTLPQTAISYSLHGDSVFIIKKEGKDKNDKPILKAYRQYVKVGERRTNEVSILEGVKAGDEVISSGQLKLQNGTHVEIDNSVEL
jgi:membrane fusion protein (multidrug efflux system)